MTKTLKNFLKKYEACEDVYLFAKDLTLKQFLDTCPRGDWILWLFRRANPESLRELTLAKGHCANTVRHLMEDERSLKAVDAAIAFGEGKIGKKQLDDAVDDAVDVDDDDAYAAAAAYAAYAADDAYAAAVGDDAYAAVVAAYAAAAYAYADADARKQSRQQTADICRKYLPLEIWNEIDS
jgi:hypothetical protein